MKSGAMSVRVKVSNFALGVTIHWLRGVDVMVKKQSWSTLFLPGSVDTEKSWVEADQMVEERFLSLLGLLAFS